MLLDTSMAKIYGGQARRWARAWKQSATIENKIALSALRVGKQEVSRLQARLSELEEALRRALCQWEWYASADRASDIYLATDEEANLFRRVRKVLDHE